jgi:hypothetical protein
VSFDDLRLPDWLPEVVMRGLLPWEKGVRATVADFLGTYPLRTSVWIGLWGTPPGHAIAAFRWNTQLFSERVAYPGPNVVEWPILLVRFPSAYQILFAGIESSAIVEEAHSRAVGAEERQANIRHLLKQPAIGHLFREQWVDESLQHTVIQEASGSQTAVFHGGEASFLCFTKDGDELLLPGLGR